MVGLLLAGVVLGGCGAVDDFVKRDAGPDASPAALMLDRDSIDFGSWAVNEDSASRTLRISNRGQSRTGPVTLSVAGAGFFLYSNPSCEPLLPGAFCSAVLFFRPSAPGATNGLFSATALPGGMVSTSLTGIGLRPGMLSVSATPVEGVHTVVGTISEVAVVTARNVGEGQLRNFRANLTEPEHFFVLTTCGSGGSDALPGQRSCDFRVKFAPRSRGLHRTALIITGGNESVPVALAATGLAPAKLAINPLERVFAVAVNTATAPVTFLVGNTGDVQTGLPEASFTGQLDDFRIVRNACITPIPPLATCAVDLVFQPRAGGTKIAGLLVTASPGGTASAVLTGTGQ
jgi:hypothetical protein